MTSSKSHMPASTVLTTSLILIVSLMSIFFVSKRTGSDCIKDIDVLSLAETDKRSACSTYGQMQLEYLRDNFLYAFANSDIEDEYESYFGSRLAFGSPQIESSKISAEGLDVFQVALLASSFNGELEGKRGTLYIVAYMGMANTLYEEKRREPSLILDAVYYTLDFNFDYEGNNLVLFAVCFWEYDIPSLPAEVVFESKVVSQCIKENRYNL